MTFLAAHELVNELTDKDRTLARDCPVGHLYTGLENSPVTYQGRRINGKTRLIYGYHVLPPRHASAKELHQFAGQTGELQGHKQQPQPGSNPPTYAGAAGGEGPTDQGKAGAK